jgi:hypothetical protein
LQKIQSRQAMGALVQVLVSETFLKSGKANARVKGACAGEAGLVRREKLRKSGANIRISGKSYPD